MTVTCSFLMSAVNGGRHLGSCRRNTVEIYNMVNVSFFISWPFWRLSLPSQVFHSNPCSFCAAGSGDPPGPRSGGWTPRPSASPCAPTAAAAATGAGASSASEGAEDGGAAEAASPPPVASAVDSEEAVEAGSSLTLNIGKTTKLLRSLQESWNQVNV